MGSRTRPSLRTAVWLAYLSARARRVRSDPARLRAIPIAAIRCRMFSGASRLLPRLLCLTDLLELGGAEVQLTQLCAVFDRKRLDPRVASLRGPGRLGRLFSIPPTDLKMAVPGDPRAYRRFVRLLERDRIDAVYTTHCWSAIFTWLACRRRAKRPLFVATEHGFQRPGASPLLEPIRLRAVRSADFVISVSTAQAEWMSRDLRISPDRIVVLPNAIDPEPFAEISELTPEARRERRTELGLERDRPVIVSVARLVPEKDPMTLLEAVMRLDAQLIFVGDGPLRLKLEMATQSMGLASRVRFAGTQSDTRPFLAVADVAVLASIHESQGIVLLEAMAAGLPVVATRVGGIPEVVLDGITGILVTPRDAPSLAEALSRVLSDREFARMLGSCGRERARRDFSLTVRARALEDMILGAVAARRA